MNYTPPEDLNFHILAKNCSRHHGFSVYRSQNCDKTVILLNRKLRGGAKKWGLLFFFKKYKIENNGFITILGSVDTKGMMSTTDFG